jgi:DNA-binding SARP family transcriptional activator
MATGAAVAVAARLEDAHGVDFRVLGPVEARADGRVLTIPGARQRVLLALLLLRRGAPVARDELVDDMWGETPPEGAVNALQVAASRLRRALGGEARRLVGTPTGYRLLLEPGELDLERFERASEEGRRALAEEQPERAAARLRAALAEWQGRPLADVAFEPFAQVEIARLEALYAAAIEDRIQADLESGRHAELVPELEALVARHPLRERLRAQLMLALYRAGRQGEALEAYRDAARTLDAELGLRPGPELERVQRAILAQDADVRPVAAPTATPAERRRSTATLLFTDVVGSTRIRAKLGDEEADAVRREHDRRMRDALAVHRGREIKALGDGFLAVFGSAADAIACGVDVQRATDRQAHRGPVAVAVRVGIAAGDVAWEESDVFGTPVVEAQRLCMAADSAEILIADAVRLLAGSLTDAGLEDAGERSLRGLDHPVRAWRVRWAADRTVSVPLAPALAVEGAPPFAGRERELDALRIAWRDATGGRRRGVLVSGEPGIGKTRLAAELAAEAAREGAAVLYGRCDEGLAAAAQPFAEALSAYAAACPRDELRVQLGARAADLAPLLPALRERLPGLPEPAPAAPEVERLRTLEAASALLGAASAMTPLVLVLDDLHWADELSLLLVQHVLRTDEQARLLVLATYRDSEPARSPLLADVLAGLARRHAVSRLELAPLDERDVAALLAGAGRKRSLAARVRAMTEGNPFFVGEVIQALGDDDPAEPPLTSRVRDVVRWRLARLPAGAEEVLTVAAVAGPEFDVDVVADASSAGADRVLDAIEAAERARLVRPAGAPDRFAFAHALVRQAIVDSLPAGRRVRLHARLAEALERASTARSVPIAELAAHFDSAGALVDAHATLRYARRAGDEAAQRLAFDVASEHYDRARRAHARLPDAAVEERLDLDLARGRALRFAGDPGATEALLQMAGDAERAGDGVRMAEALLANTLGMAADWLHEDQRAIGLLRRALTLLPAEDSAARACLEASLALEAMYSMPDAERRATADRALAMARRIGDPSALADVLNAHSWTVMDPLLRRERLALADELVQVGPLTSPYAECEGHRFRFLALAEDGDIAAADAALDAARAAARLPVTQWSVIQWESIRALLGGRLAEAEELMSRGARAARHAGMRGTVVQFTALSLLWCIRLAQGRLHEFSETTAAVALMPNRPTWTYASEAQVALARGDRDRAREALETAFAGGLLHTPHGFAWMITMTGAADVCAELGDSVHGAPLYDLLAPRADVMSPWCGPVARAAGELAVTLGHRDEAERLLRKAVALCERMDARAFLAICRHDLGRLRLPDTEGRALLERARAAAEELGMPGWAARAQAALAGEPGVGARR